MQVEVVTNILQMQLDHYEIGVYHVIFYDGEKLISSHFIISK